MLLFADVAGKYSINFDFLDLSRMGFPVKAVDYLTVRAFDLVSPDTVASMTAYHAAVDYHSFSLASEFQFFRPSVSTTTHSTALAVFFCCICIL